jgi:hypothetical protein
MLRQYSTKGRLAKDKIPRWQSHALQKDRKIDTGRKSSGCSCFELHFSIGAQ